MVPPARNFALSPETAVTVGSASVWATPWRSNACSVALKLWPPLTQFSMPSEAATAPLIANGFSSVKLPFGPVPLMLTPSCLMISRRISATVTLRLTWSSPRMVRELMTFPPAPLALAPGPLEPAPLAPTEMETLPAPAVDGAVESLTKPEAISSAF